jgi:predicted PurR-regulated permease PerM
MFTRVNFLGLSDFWYVVIVVGVFTGIHLFENYWLRPNVLGKGMGLHPAVILVSVLGALTLGGGLLALVVVPVIRSVGEIVRYLISKLSDQDPWEEAKDRPTLDDFFAAEGLEAD